MRHDFRQLEQMRSQQLFNTMWDGYSERCFGHDTLHFVSNTCEDDFGGYGATAIDSLPTAIIFGNEATAFQILEFIATLDFKMVKGGTRIQVFEVTIRHFLPWFRPRICSTVHSLIWSLTRISDMHCMHK